jgi:oxygen-dependent protoporphyrinogen oxidase
VFYGLPGGIARIVDRLTGALRGEAGLHPNSPVASIEAVSDGADAVVVAVPAREAAGLLRPLSSEAAAELATIGYASVAQVVVEIPRHGVDRELDASGILFPRGEGTLLTACTWLSSKWAHYRRAGSVLLRLSSGRYGDERPAALADAQLAERLLAELSEVVPVTARPVATRVVRWRRAFPQYAPGHAALVDRAVGALAASAPTIRLAGAAYRGIGIPACIESGRSAARSLIDDLG